ncbi:unnamed protein product [Prunus armeniaca]|uniref:Uncharacterized protein n=1 Tax=Prunus armeniaca TaxID=36596 RepID=A0A6J5TI49_PRUAR|nr:unnamed protein product [Prunus armeniaca]CAB4294216.1 unnamed protein product [Prunus armeniaca]
MREGAISIAIQTLKLKQKTCFRRNDSKHFFVWREFLCGANSRAFGEGIMRPVVSIKISFCWELFSGHLGTCKDICWSTLARDVSFSGLMLYKEKKSRTQLVSV